MDKTTRENAEGKTVPQLPVELRASIFGLLLAALGMGAVMGKQVIADLAALAGQVPHLRSEAVLLRVVELFSRGLRGMLEEAAEPLPAGSALRREIDRAAADLGKVARRLSRAQKLCELPAEREAEGEGEGAADGPG